MKMSQNYSATHTQYIINLPFLFKFSPPARTNLRVNDDCYYSDDVTIKNIQESQRFKYNHL